MAEPALAATGLVLRRHRGGAPLVLDLALEIGAGGEARVLAVPHDRTRVAKLYHAPTLAHARKLALMLEEPPRLEPGAALAWPVDLLTDLNGGRFAGFLMPRAEGPRVFEFYNPVSRRKTAPLFDWALLHRAAGNLATAFDGLHARGYVIGDVNESNILVSPDDAGVTLVDADSFQVRDPAGGAVFRSHVGKAEFTPPELQGTRFAEVDRAPEHDRFGLAVLVFLLLMEGTHPFASRFEHDGEALPVEERIRRGMFPHVPFDGVKPPRMAPPFEVLHPALRALFLRAFVQGHRDPAARPAAAEWREALATAEGAMKSCAANPRHRFAAHVPYCPWCHRARLLQGRDPFPATLALARATDAAAAPRPRPQAAPPQRPHPAPAAPFAPAPAFAPPPPSPTAVALANAVNRVRVMLPVGVQPVLTADGLGNPLVWMAPAGLTCLFGASGGVRALGMVVFFLALRRVFQPGAIRIRPITVFTAGLALLVWLLFAAPLFSARPDDVFIDRPVSSAEAAPVVGPPADVAPAPEGDAFRTYELSEVDTPPSLVNPDGVKAMITRDYPVDLRARGISGTARVRMRVQPDGAVDPTSIQVLDASRIEFHNLADRVAGGMRFEPARVRGEAVWVWVTLPLTFSP